MRRYLKLAGSVVTIHNTFSLQDLDEAVVAEDEDDLEDKIRQLFQFFTQANGWELKNRVDVPVYWKLNKSNLVEFAWKFLNPADPEGPVLFIFGKGGDRLKQFTDESPRKTWTHGH